MTKMALCYPVVRAGHIFMAHAAVWSATAYQSLHKLSIFNALNLTFKRGKFAPEKKRIWHLIIIIIIIIINLDLKSFNQ